MKKYITLLALLIVTIGMAQPPQDDNGKERRKNKEKIQALAIAYITEQLELSPDESTKFWPILNDLRDKRHGLERKKRTLIREMETKLDAMTDNQATSYIDTIANLELEIHQSSYTQNRTEIIKIIGAKRFLKLMKSEMDFRKKMLIEYKGRRGKGRP